MAKNTARATAPSHQSFADSLLAISYRFSLHQVFDDFLTMAIAASTQNPTTKLSWYEEEYRQTIAPYKDSELKHEFSKAFALLILEMQERVGSEVGNDVLGDFFEVHMSKGRNGQFFTPYPICKLLATITQTDRTTDSERYEDIPLKVIDPTCGSGRMLLAAHSNTTTRHEYYGIDIGRMCVKMTALNLFLNGMWDSEVMCADALRSDDFVIAYHISSFPLGIFKIEDKEQSRLWHMHRNSFGKSEKQSIGASIMLDKTPLSERSKDIGTQLYLF